MKLTYVKDNPKIEFYRITKFLTIIYNIFDNYLFQVDLENGLT